MNVQILHIPCYLQFFFVHTEVPQDILGFSPFKMVYGSNPRSPLQIDKELLPGTVKDQNILTNYQIVTNIIDIVMKASNENQEKVKTSKLKYKIYADRNAKKRTLEVGEK